MRVCTRVCTYACECIQIRVRGDDLRCRREAVAGTAGGWVPVAAEGDVASYVVRHRNIPRRRNNLNLYENYGKAEV